MKQLVLGLSFACAGLAGWLLVNATSAYAAQPPQSTAENTTRTATPIKHLVVLFNENVSFDHYFATYPVAANPLREPAFTAASAPQIDTLAAAHLLTVNPNTNPANGSDAALPFRLDRSQANTADQNHAYTAEQQAYNGGKADLFPKYTGKGSPGTSGAFATKGQVMGYFDGNTVTAMWRYAQHFAMSDAAYTDTYGPSTPGALELISGQTNGLQIVATTKKPSTLEAISYYVADSAGGWTDINDVDPAHDVCSSPTDQASMTGRNIGDLLNAAGVTWGAFMGGFNLEAKNANGTTRCARSTRSDIVGKATADYIPHHNWFQYYASTANPSHARPSSISAIGHSLEQDGASFEPANHEYDLDDFYAAVKAGNFPAVSYVKLPAYQDGHAGYSDPLDEQAGAVSLINFLEQQPDWKDTAIIVTWDDSDGWYDHAFTKPTASSFDPQADQLDGPGKCGTATLPVGIAGKPVNGRCGPGTRVPFLLISPWARMNYVDHTLISHASVVRFIEDNWLNGARLGGGSFDATAGSIVGLFDFDTHHDRASSLLLNPTTGSVMDASQAIPATDGGAN